MIQYSLKCVDGHVFDSWFQSADAFDKLQKAGMVVCAVCGATQVEKAMMAPRVRPARAKAAAPETAEPPQAPAIQPAPSLREPASELEQAVTKLRRHVEENSEYVGTSFAQEARAMHDGEAPERAIFGEAKLDEARALVEDGIPVAPLPFTPTRKAN